MSEKPQLLRFLHNLDPNFCPDPTSFALSSILPTNMTVGFGVILIVDNNYCGASAASEVRTCLDHASSGTHPRPLFNTQNLAIPRSVPKFFSCITA